MALKSPIIPQGREDRFIVREFIPEDSPFVGVSRSMDRCDEVEKACGMV